MKLVLISFFMKASNIPDDKYRNNPSIKGNPDGNHIVPHNIFSFFDLLEIKICAIEKMKIIKTMATCKN